MAAGVSKRMNTKLAKVLHEVCGRPMLDYVIDACRGVGVDKMYIVVGFSSEHVRERFGDATATSYGLSRRSRKAPPTP